MTDILFCAFYVVENVMSTTLPDPVYDACPAVDGRAASRRILGAVCSAFTPPQARGRIVVVGFAPASGNPIFFIARTTWLYAVLQCLVALATLGFIARTPSLRRPGSATRHTPTYTDLRSSGSP